MKKKLYFISTIMIVFLSLFMMTSCDNSSGKDSKIGQSTTVPTMDSTTPDNPTDTTKGRYYTVTFKNYDGTVLQTSEMKEGSTPSYNGANPTRNNDENYSYTFNGWTPSISKVTEDVVYTATYSTTVIAKTQYKVEHYQQNLDDDNYPKTPFEIDNLTGTTDTLTNASVKTYEGFTSPTITQVNINGDGSTVIKLYYTRNSYSVTLNTNNVNAGTISGDGTYKYGKEVKLEATANPGYTFVGWYDGDNEISTNPSYTFNMAAKDLSYTAKWTANTNTTYKVEHYLQNLDDDNYPELPYETDSITGTTDTLTNGEVNTYEGFTSPTITQVNINGNGSTVIKLYYTRNSYTVTLNTNNDNPGTVTGAGTYKYGKEITISATTNPGYTFIGWYKDDEEYTTDASFDYEIGLSDVTFEARYTINQYTITLDNQASGVTISGITSGNSYDYNTQINLASTGSQSGYTVRWERSDGVIYVGDNYGFIMPSSNITITTTTTRPYTREGNKIYFGSYPQTKLDETNYASRIAELNTKAGTLPTSSNKGNWTDCNYYISSSVTSYMYYQDIDYDNSETYDYRGVYFTSYRPYYSYYSSSKSYSYQGDNGYTINTVYWFSYDPIEWDILSESNGKALIIANLILDSQDYYPSNSTSTFSHNGGTGYANNYELSNIRKFLNDNFYNTTFNDFQKALIETTTVDNSASSTTSSSYENACNNTSDKMFLLSYKEATTYYSSETARTAKGSDYAKCQGLAVPFSDGNSSWRLRSPYSKYDVYFVRCDGKFIDTSATNTSSGVRPACWINL